MKASPKGKPASASARRHDDGARHRGSADRSPAAQRGAARRAPATGQRHVRVAERVRQELSEMLIRTEVKEPALAGAVVSEVVMTPDLELARVYLRCLDATPTPERARAIVAAFERAAPFVRRLLDKRLDLRRTPELRFAWDEGLDRAMRVHSILDELERERAAARAATSGDGPEEGGGDR